MLCVVPTINPIAIQSALTIIISYVCIIFCRKKSVDCKFFSCKMVLVASRNSLYSGLGSLTPGNRSEIIP